MCPIDIIWSYILNTFGWPLILSKKYMQLKYVWFDPLHQERVRMTVPKLFSCWRSGSKYVVPFLPNIQISIQNADLPNFVRWVILITQVTVLTVSHAVRFRKRLKNLVIHWEKVKKILHLFENTGNIGTIKCCSFCIWSGLRKLVCYSPYFKGVK